MRLFSNKKRPVHLGPYPLERLARADRPNGSTVAGPRRAAPVEAPEEFAISRSIGEYVALYDSLRDGEVAPALAPLPDDLAARADNFKASTYFLDASMVGICEIPRDAWLEPALDHSHAAVILVSYTRDPKPGEPGEAWIRGAQAARAALRAQEIAVVQAGYLRALGYSARAHSETLSELDHDRLVVEAGLGAVGRDGVANPFVGRRFAVAVVSTDMAMACDRPLAGNGRRGAQSLAYWLGLGGSEPAWRRLTGKHRPFYMGRFPMEKIKRVATTTTLITDAVPRVPKRAAFFARALHGDLGEKTKRERRRFAFKTPQVAGMMQPIAQLVALQDGPVAASPAPGTDAAPANADAVKAIAYYLGGDAVGICEAAPFAWYSHHGDGTPIEPYHKSAITILIDQGFETMEGASGDDWISGAQSMRAYLRSAEIAGVLAAHIRRLGYSARSHTNADSDVLHIPLIMLAGLGELSRIGELVLNPFVGPRFKSVVVTTDLPLRADQPIDFGLQDFCEQCMKCARECPPAAISFGPKVMFNGYEMWKPDVEKCTRYRVTNPKGSACGRCMKMCPFNTEGLLVHRLFLWAAINLPFTRPWIARLDDKVGNGRRNPVKRWWYDLEVVDRISVLPKGTNERDLNLDKVIRAADQKLAHFPADMMPPPDHGDPFPVDREAGLRRAAAAETPQEARRRLKVP